MTIADISVAEPAEGGGCRWCGANHGKLCPWVKAIEYGHPDYPQRTTRVEFFTPVELGVVRHRGEEAETAPYARLGEDEQQ